ncbi:MAG: UbiA family prenyltransferase [Pirellulaceae bacterium]
MSKLAAYLRLMRISLLPTAWSNVLMGFALVVMPSPSANHWWALPCLLVCSSCLYLAGMVLNDVFDVELDRVERPERVLPSGLIPVQRAHLFGWGLLVAGVLLAGAASLVLSMADGSAGTLNVSPLLVAFVLAGLVVLYNAWAKRSPSGPLVMGLCRSMNVLLGCSVYAWEPVLAGFDAASLIVAGAMGLYIAGITLFAREEQRTSHRRYLLMGASAMLAGVAILFWFPFSEAFAWLDSVKRDAKVDGSRHLFLYAGLLAMMLFPVFRRVTVAMATRESHDVQSAVIISLLTIIMIDASICYLVSPETPAYALVVAALLIPAWLMSRRISAT